MNIKYKNSNVNKNKVFEFRIPLSEIILSVFAIVFALIFLFFFLYMPFPERWSPDEFDENMFRTNQHITFYCLIVFGTFMIATYVTSIVLRTILASYYYKIEINNLNKENNKFWILIIGYICLIIINSFVPFILSSILINNIKKEKQIGIIKSKKLYASYISFICLVPILTIGIAVPSALIKTPRVVMSKNAILSNLTYSTDSENTITLYFDRGMGSVWNMLLYEDYIKNNENSFMYKFKDFNSYINSITTGYPTNFSNGYMQGSLWFGADLLNQNMVNPLTNKKYNVYTQNSYLNEVLTFNINNYYKEYGYKYFDYMDIPYYGKEFTTLGGEYWTLDNDLKKIDNQNISANSSSATPILQYFNKPNYQNILDLGYNQNSAYYLKMIGDKENSNLIFGPTKGNVYKYLYFQNTHGPYVIEKPDGTMQHTGDDFKDWISSMRFSIRELNNFFSILQNTKHSKSGSVYDHTNIIILSDHGNNVIDKYKTEVENFWNEITQYGATYGNENDLNIFRNYIRDYGFINSIFMYKPSIDSNINNESNRLLNFNTTDLINNFDFPLVTESLMYKSKYKTNPTKSIYKPDISNFNSDIYNNIDKNIIINPTQNSSLLNNRVLLIKQAHWKFEADSNHFTENKINEIEFDYRGATNIFNAKYKRTTQLV